MLRLPHNRRSRFQLVLVLVFLASFYLGVRYVANQLQADSDALELQDAIQRGDVEEVQRLLATGHGLNGRNPASGGWRDTPLHFAIRIEKEPFARLLLEHGADPNTMDGYGETPLHTTAINGRLDLAKLLVAHGASLHTKRRHEEKHRRSTPALTALQNDHIELARYLLFEAGEGDLKNEDVDRLLEAAAGNATTDLVRSFLDADANPRRQVTKDCWPLYYAAIGGSYEIVELLIARGATVRGLAPESEAELMVAAVAGKNASIVRLFAQHGIGPNAVRVGPGDTALHNAAQHGAIDLARELMKHGWNANARDKMGNTPLHDAIEQAHPEMVEFLIKNGADATISDAEGRTAIESAKHLLERIQRHHYRNEHWERLEAIIELLEDAAASSQ